MRLCFLMVCASVLATSSGCLVMHERKRVIREDESRNSVQFESADAAAKFHQVASNDRSRKHDGSSASLAIPFLVGISSSTVLSQNAFFNDQVVACDTDNNGLITEAEVAHLVGQKSKRR